MSSKEAITKFPALQARIPKENIRLEDLLSSELSEEKFISKIRQYKYQELWAILQDNISGKLKIADTLKSWSSTADDIIKVTYNYALKNRLSRHNITKICDGAILALGKLGSRELNISSDVDLIVVYADDEENKLNLTNHEFYCNLTTYLTYLLSALTPDGFAFRVDHELRPEGTKGPLANSYDAIIRYYQYFGSDWERQALIRARPVAGNLRLGNKLIEELRPFIFRRHLTIKDLDGLKKLKESVEKKSSANTAAFDIKYGKGGIREVEFFVQFLQLVYGGINSRIIATNTFEAIEALSKSSLLHPNTKRQLLNAYEFLRKTESILHSMLDQQTFKIPDDQSILDLLLKNLGYDGCNSQSLFMKELNEQTQAVNRFFTGLFASDYSKVELEEAIRENITKASNAEELADSFAWFRKNEFKRLANLDLTEKIELKALLKALSSVADVILSSALFSEYFTPIFSKKATADKLAIIGLGKLGSQEMDYGSDIDICFIYDDTDGSTACEEFTKISQRLISLITLPTRYGKAFAVDSELRPSGKLGVLVAPLSSLVSYHKTNSAAWEKFAWLKARIIFAQNPFYEKLQNTLDQISYDLPITDESALTAEILSLRKKVHAELNPKDANTINLKNGSGCLYDIESIVSYHHLLGAGKHDELKKQNTFEIIEALNSLSILEERIAASLLGHLSFFRRLISRLRLITTSSTAFLSKGSETAEFLSKNLGFQTQEHLFDEIKKRRIETEKLFNSFIAG